MCYACPEIGSDWKEVVARIQAGDQTGVEDLYEALSRLVGASLLRVVGTQCFEDSLHEIVVIVLQAIGSGGVHDAGRLGGFMRTVARRQMVAHIRGAISQRQRFVAVVDFNAMPGESPEVRAADQERSEELMAVLDQLRDRDREIIERFYFREERREQICGEMHLTGTQFRLYKSRALAKCSRLARAGRVPYRAAAAVA